MSENIAVINDLKSGQIFEKPMTDDEIKAKEKAHAEFIAAKEAELQKIAARQELLNRLGITKEEAKLLLS